MRKIIIYQRYASKPIILTDSSSDSSEDLQKKILELFESKKISVFETDSDILYVRPSEVQSVLITKSNEISEKPSTKE